MRKSAMMRESESPPVELPQDIQIGSLSRQRHRKGRKRCLSVESGAAQARASQKVSDRFQEMQSK
jgi:hypothetical protein